MANRKEQAIESLAARIGVCTSTIEGTLILNKVMQKQYEDLIASIFKYEQTELRKFSDTLKEHLEEPKKALNAVITKKKTSGETV